MTAQFPIATEPDGDPIKRWHTVEFTFNTPSSSASFEYPAVREGMPDAKLYRRSGKHDSRELIPREAWSFGACDSSRPAADSNRAVCLPDGFSPDFVYDLVYEATDPIVMGIGFAAVRDFVSFLRYQSAEGDELGPSSGALTGGAIRWALIFGTSQSGRFIRDFIYQGFTQDAAGRRVFDGAVPQGAGALRTFTNAEFAVPGRFPVSVRNHFVPGDEFPFSFVTMTDPITGRVDGLLKRCGDSRTCPKIMQWDSASEAWAARSSLIVTDPLGTKDVQLPDDVRVYQFASVQHLVSAFYSPQTWAACQYQTNTSNSYRELQRALLVAMQEWVSDDVPPPPSAHPKLSDGTLVPPLPQSGQGFPDIPGLTYTGMVNDLAVNDRSVLPWQHTDGFYTVLVPKVDRDGNDIAGVRTVTTQVPLGTYTGWNLRQPGRLGGELCYPVGLFAPFATTALERGTDPRRSLEERYGTHARYVEQVRMATERLARARLLLPRDAERVVREAERRTIGLPPS